MIDTPETFARKLDALISSDPDRDWSLDDRAVAMIAARDADIRAEAGRWIPVEERLPEKNERGWDFSDDVLVAVRCDNGAEFVSKDRFDHNGPEWCAHRGARDGRHVTHWQPLPAPPAAERSDADA
jgi:hypothetical protein